MISGGHRILQLVALAGMVVVVCELVSFNLAIVFACRYVFTDAAFISIPALISHRPMSAYWTVSSTFQQCISEHTHIFVGGLFNTLTDFLVILLPLPIILSLQVHRRQQILLCLLFGGGVATCITGIIKEWYSWQEDSTYDFTWFSYGVWISSTLELNIGLVSKLYLTQQTIY